jgi:hypothetical protein
MLAYLLQLAGLLAIDIRLLSDVIVDHIGLADPLLPEQILKILNQARWNPSGRGRVLRVTCNHPAIDLALSDHVEHGNSTLTHIVTVPNAAVLGVKKGALHQCVLQSRPE